MEIKGRRIPRVAGPIGASDAAAQPIEVPVVEERATEVSTEPLAAAEILAEAAKPAETAVNLVVTAEAAISQPMIETVAAAPRGAPAGDPPDFGRDTLAALTQSQCALARGLELLSAEMTGLAFSSVDTAARTATKILGVKTLSDAIEVNAGFTCSSLDTLLGGSARLSQLGVKLATETTQSILSQFGKTWARASNHTS